MLRPHNMSALVTVKIVKIQKEPAFPNSRKSRLCVLRLAHLLLAIFSCMTSIIISFLHLGQ